jgi:hypothetical protein
VVRSISFGFCHQYRPDVPVVHEGRPIRVLINLLEITDDFLEIYKSGCNVRVDNEGDVGKAWYPRIPSGDL